MFNCYSNKSLPAKVHVRIRGRVVQVPVGETGIRTVVPVTPNVGKLAL